MLRIALSKGRLQESFLKAVYGGNPFYEKGDRRLKVRDCDKKWEYIFPKAGDVPQYLEKGMADVGVFGLDVLEESGIVFERKMALDFGGCEMAIAGPKKKISLQQGMTVATKYPNIADKIFKERGMEVKIIALSGSVELAVTTGIAEVIVDIIQTGRTLKENGLIVYESLFDVTAYMVFANGLKGEKLAQAEGLMESLNKMKAVG